MHSLQQTSLRQVQSATALLRGNQKTLCWGGFVLCTSWGTEHQTRVSQQDNQKGNFCATSQRSLKKHVIYTSCFQFYKTHFSLSLTGIYPLLSQVSFDKSLVLCIFLIVIICFDYNLNFVNLLLNNVLFSVRAQCFELYTGLHSISFNLVTYIVFSKCNILVDVYTIVLLLAALKPL